MGYVSIDEQELRELRAGVKSLNTTVASLGANLAKVAGQRDKYWDWLRGVRSKLEAVRSELEAAQDERDRFEDERDALHRELAEVQDKLWNAEASLRREQNYANTFQVRTHQPRLFVEGELLTIAQVEDRLRYHRERAVRFGYKAEAARQALVRIEALAAEELHKS